MNGIQNQICKQSLFQSDDDTVNICNSNSTAQLLYSRQVELSWVESFSNSTIDAQGLKIQRTGYLMFLPKSLGGGVGGIKAFRKNCQGRSPYFGFYCIFISKCFEICLRGVLYLPVTSPHLTPLCASMVDNEREGVNWSNYELSNWVELSS